MPLPLSGLPVERFDRLKKYFFLHYYLAFRLSNIGLRFALALFYLAASVFLTFLSLPIRDQVHEPNFNYRIGLWKIIFFFVKSQKLSWI